MSPEIRRAGHLVADVPDETGLHKALDGSPLYVDVSGIEARNNIQLLILEGLSIGGRRIIRLTQEGRGNTNHPKRGDGKQPPLEVILHERPIRITYKSIRERIGGPRYYLRQGNEGTHYNPRWIRR